MGHTEQAVGWIWPVECGWLTPDTVYPVLCLASLIQHHVWHSSVLLRIISNSHYCAASHCTAMPPLFIHSPVNKQAQLFTFLYHNLIAKT